MKGRLIDVCTGLMEYRQDDVTYRSVTVESHYHPSVRGQGKGAVDQSPGRAEIVKEELSGHTVILEGWKRCQRHNTKAGREQEEIVWTPSSRSVIFCQCLILARSNWSLASKGAQVIAFSGDGLLGGIMHLGRQTITSTPSITGDLSLPRPLMKASTSLLWQVSYSFLTLWGLILPWCLFPM